MTEPSGLTGIAPSGAVISACGKYRTLLWRRWTTLPPLTFVMLNPSTADANVPDPTITRCVGFAKRENFGGLVVVNLSPFRTAYPRDMEAARRAGVDVVAEGINREAWRQAQATSDGVVFAWGAGIRPWMDRLARLARDTFRNPMCLGRTKMGEPRHPLMLRSDTPLEHLP